MCVVMVSCIHGSIRESIRQSQNSRLSRSASIRLTYLFASSTPEADSPEVQWYALQTLFEQAKSDVLILLDCCAAASSAAGSVTGVTEIIAACGFETIAPGVGKHSFTRSLIGELKYLSSRPSFSAALLHNQVLARIKYFNPRYATGGHREPRRTPVYIVLANEAKKRSIELVPMVLQDPLTINNGLAIISPAQVSTPSSGISDDVDTQSLQSSKSSIDEIWHDAQSNYPRVLISIALEEDQLLRCDEWTEWLKSIPTFANTVAVEGVYQSDSTLFLLSLPVAVWDMLPEGPAISFIGFVKTSNMLTTPKKLTPAIVTSLFPQLELISIGKLPRILDSPGQLLEARSWRKILTSGLLGMIILLNIICLTMFFHSSLAVRDNKCFPPPVPVPYSLRRFP